MKAQNLKLMSIYRAIERYSQNPNHRRYDTTELADDLIRRNLLDVQDMAVEKTRKLIKAYSKLKQKNGEPEKAIFAFTITDEDGERHQYRAAANQMTPLEAGICMDENVARVKQDIEAIQKAHDLFRSIHGPTYKYFGQPFLNGFAPWDDVDRG